MKYILSILSLLILLAVLNCGSDSGYHTEVTKIGRCFSDYNALVSDSLADYLVVTQGDITNHRSYQGMIYKRDFNRPEFSWRQLKDRYDGETYGVFNSDNYIFIFCYEYTTKEYKPSQAGKYLHMFCKAEQKIIKSFDVDSLYIKDLYMINDSSWYMLGNYTNYAYQTCVVSTFDMGKTFDTAYIDRVIDQSKFDDRILYFINSKINGDTGYFYQYYLSNNSLDSTIFDFTPYDFAFDNNRLLWVLGTKGDSVLLKKQGGDMFNTVYTFCVDTVSLPKNLYFSDDLIIAYVSQIDYGAMFGLGGTRNLFYYSDDVGENWRMIDEFENALYLKALSVYQNKRISACVGSDRILTVYLDNRDLK